jgi:DNA repair ATPase RecN
MLKKIEDRLSELRKITKKYTPAMRETFKSKDQLRETVK